MLLYFVLASELLSAFLLYKIWNSHDHIIFKLIIGVLVIIPFVGPIFYLIGSDNTPRKHSNLNASGNLFGRGRYTEWWNAEKERMENKIKEAKEKNKQNKEQQ